MTPPPVLPAASQTFDVMFPLPPELFALFLGIVALFLVYYVYKLLVSLLPV